MNNFQNPKVLLVEDDAIIALTESAFLEAEGFMVIHVFTAEDGIAHLKTNPNSIDLILMDIDLGENRMSGTDASQIILKEFSLPLVFLSSHTEKEIVEKTEGITSYGYIVKHSGNTVLLASVKMALKLFYANKKLQENETNLKKSEESLIRTIQSIGDGFIATDIHGNIVRMNPIAEKLCGWEFEEAHGKPLEEVFHIINHDTRLRVQNPVQKVLELGQIVGLANHTVLISKTKNEFQIADTAAPIYDLNQNIAGVVLVFSDITERKRSEILLTQSQNRLAGIIESAMDGIISINESQQITLINPAAERIFGYNKEEILGQSINKLIPERFHSSHGEHIEKFGKTGVTTRSMNALGVVFGVRANGSEFPLEASISQIQIGKEKIFTIILRDITERRLSELKIQELLHEKEILLKEVHHRIKNNMQAIIGLLNIKNSFIQDNKTSSIIKETISQIHGMSLLYDKLYRTTNYTNVSANDYLSELIEKIVEIHSLLVKIKLSVDIDEFFLNTRILFPLGIIINEVITNSIKYAFQDSENNKIDVQMKLIEDVVSLTIHDNGKGFSEQSYSKMNSGFGLKLISMLSKQLNAKHEIKNDDGVKFRIEFQLDGK
ncbi:MAG: PAS domain S-box protein [Leptospiraceae bacterium]|nr:PAS domain S-box protein [Leptospiraceae bacterium]